MPSDPAPPADARRTPVIGITIGDPLGIGPEIVVRMLAAFALRRDVRFLVYGMNQTLTTEAERLGIEPDWFRVAADSSRAERAMSEPVVVLDHPEFEPADTATRAPSRGGGLASKSFVETAITDLKRADDHPRHIDAVVTAPISKESWRMAGYGWPGHTELFAQRFKSPTTSMMFVSPRLRVILATAHIPLMSIRDVLTIGRVFDPIELGNRACMKLGIEHPRIATALALVEECGEVARCVMDAECYGKDTRAALADEVGDVLVALAEVSERHGLSLQAPAEAALLKIEAKAGGWREHLGGRLAALRARWDGDASAS